MKSIKKCLQQLSSAKSIAILTHVKPDADAICSSIALKRILKKHYAKSMKKTNIDVFFDIEEIAEKYLPLVKDEELKSEAEINYDLAICLDCPSSERMGKFEEIFNNAKQTLNIDHHNTNTSFAKNNICTIKSSSTCELVYYLIDRLFEWKTSESVCKLIYAGIITDTNNLTQNIGENTMFTISKLMKKNEHMEADLQSVRDYFFKNDSKEQISLLQRALNSIMFCENNKIATMKLIKQDFNETNTTQEDTMGIVDYATKIKGVEIGIMFIKNENNTYYVSLRSKNEVDVSLVAQQMGGGGHKNIAAFQTQEGETLTDIKNKLIPLCKEEIKKHITENVDIENMFTEKTNKKTVLDNELEL